MRRCATLLAALATSAPALAQLDPHAGHVMPEERQPVQDPHAGHHMPAEEQPDAEGHGDHGKTAAEPQSVADPHAAHRSPAEPQPGEHQLRQHDSGSAHPPPKAPPPPEALTGPEHAADTAFDPARMAASREALRREHGGLPAHRFMIERAEARVGNGGDGFLVDAQAWYGGDLDKVWFKGEVEGSWGERPAAEIQGLWSHAIGPWFDLQTGLRYDPQPGPDRAHLVLGVQGLAPYWWDVDAALFLSNKGDLTARVEAEYDLRITQKLILQPRAELRFSLQDIPELGIGTGLSEAAVGARLRYQLSPLLAPYVGVEYERAFGDTADFRRVEADGVGSWHLVAGVRMWF